MRARADVLAALMLALFALAGIFWAIPRETIEGDPGEIAPADVPTIALWVILICSVWQAIAALSGRAGGSPSFDRFAGGFLALGALTLLAAMAGIWGLGYIAGGVLCVFAIGAAMRPKGITWAWLAGVSVVLPVAIYHLTWHGLRLSLP